MLLETHVRFDRLVVFWKKQGFTAVAIVVEANGHASGIWILTNGGNCLISIIDAMTQCVTVLKITAGSFNWFFSAVYASPISSLWTHFWDQLITVRSLAVGPWVLIGDSNEVIIPSETLGGAFSMTRAGRFREVNYGRLQLDGFGCCRSQIHLA